MVKTCLLYMYLISADIGGTMGLFVGASVITLVELADVVIHGMCKVYLSRKNKSKIIMSKPATQTRT